MSKELEELRRMARAERQAAWEHARLVPGRVGDLANAFSRRHPFLAMGGAAALATALVARRHHRNGVEGGSGSWPAALGAVGVKFLPEITRLLGLTVPPSDESIERDP